MRGLAWTAVGGEVLDVEVNVVEGGGKTELTGNLGEVMKESAKAAITYNPQPGGQSGDRPEFNKNRDIHIHFPEGPVPKDGPSGHYDLRGRYLGADRHSGPGDLAMTGEITLRGRILPIGGLKESPWPRCGRDFHRRHPAANEADLDEIDQNVRRALKFIPADMWTRSRTWPSTAALSENDGPAAPRAPACRQGQGTGVRIGQ